MEIFNRFPNSDVLKPCVFDMLKLSLKVLVVDNEENSLTALRIIFDLHKSFRPSLENQVQVRRLQTLFFILFFIKRLLLLIICHYFNE